MTTLTVSGTIDEIIAFADVLKLARTVMADATPDPTKLTSYEVSLVKTGQMISAIKEVRQRTGRDLREAKDFVEGSPEARTYCAANPLPPPPQAAAAPPKRDSAMDTYRSTPPYNTPYPSDDNVPF